jgi:hypothetical protein
LWPDSQSRLSVRVEAARVVAITAVAASLIILFAPPAGDAAAHLYRTYLVDENILVWDTFWYRGNYPIFTYSLLYYPVAALVGTPRRPSPGSCRPPGRSRSSSCASGAG